MQFLHMCSSEQKYEEAWAQFAKIYATNNKKMYDYIKKEWIDNFKHKDRNTVRYKGKINKFVINLNDKGCFNNCSCSCDTFTKEAVCMHLL